MVPVTPAGPGQNCSALAFPTLDPRHARGSRPIQRARSFRRRPESGGGMGGANDTQTPPPISAHNFRTLVCRRPPARAIGTKMRLNGFRMPNEPLHSSFPRRRESRGEGWHQPHPKRFQQPDPHFHTLVCRRQPAWAIATELTRAVRHQSKIDPGRTLGQCQIPKATSELQFVRINS